MPRLPQARGVRAIESLERLPDVVALDSSFVAEAVLTGQPLHAICRDFLVRCASAATVLVFSPLLEIELAETAFKVAIREQHGNRSLARLRSDGRIRRRAGRLMDETLEAWNEVLGGFDWGTMSIEDLGRLVPDLMRRYGLASYDAVHAATAFTLGVHDFVTLDYDFANLPENQARILTPDDRVRGMRRRRGGR